MRRRRRCGFCWRQVGREIMPVARVANVLAKHVAESKSSVQFTRRTNTRKLCKPSHSCCCRERAQRREHNQLVRRRRAAAANTRTHTGKASKFSHRLRAQLAFCAAAAAHLAFGSGGACRRVARSYECRSQLNSTQLKLTVRLVGCRSPHMISGTLLFSFLLFALFCRHNWPDFKLKWIAYHSLRPPFCQTFAAFSLKRAQLEWPVRSELCRARFAAAANRTARPTNQTAN